MKLKFKRIGNGWYEAGIYRGNGGVSSLIQAKAGPFWYAFKVFLNPMNYWKAYHNK